MDRGLTLLAETYADSLHFWQRVLNREVEAGVNVEVAAEAITKTRFQIEAIDSRLGSHFGFSRTVEDMLQERRSA